MTLGDVLGGGRGWASTILYNTKVRQEFEAFFRRSDTFTLGVCNGAQALCQLQNIIPGAGSWPIFDTNVSEQYESRLSMVKITDSKTAPNVFLHGMHGSCLPIPVAHGEGRASFTAPASARLLVESQQVAMQYVDNKTREPTQSYPSNPNGSPLGIAAVASENGRGKQWIMTKKGQCQDNTSASWHQLERSTICHMMLIMYSSCCHATPGTFDPFL